MLARKRGALRNKGRKMKKNAPTALQVDVTSDEEWGKILGKEGLILVDVYSDWSGPCISMISILKKIKMELGGDSLSYATAKCDNITSLARFRGKSEPTWMFIRGGKMINFMYGANCPKLQELLIKELKRLKTNHPPEFSLDVSEISPVETERINMIAEMNAAQNAERLAREEMIFRKKYEAELAHYLEIFKYETCILLFPWMFKDEEGNKIEKSDSPTYLELFQSLLPQQFKIDEEVDVHLDVDDITVLQKECDFDLSEETQELLLDDETVCIRLTMKDKLCDIDVDNLLVDLVYGEPVIPETPEELVEGCFVERNLPQLPKFIRDSISYASSIDKSSILLTTVWVPFNPRNRIVVFRHFFEKYVNTKPTYKDPDDEIPIVLLKYDTPRRKELQVVMEAYKKAILYFGVFERDKLPNPKLIAISMEQFERDIEEKTSYEVFVCVIKKISNEAFLSFAGIGPYYVSESHEIAKVEAPLYFPSINDIDDDDDDGDNDDKKSPLGPPPTPIEE